MARTTTPGEARRRAAAGFTLIELITVVALIGILAAIALPNYKVAIIQSREAVLKENLFRLRDLIDQYYVDKGQYPPSLETLVEEGYLRKLPEDPFTRSARLDAGLRRARPGPAGGAARRLRRQERLRARLARGHAVQRVVKAVGYSMTRLRSVRLVARRLLLRAGGRRLRRALGLPPGAGRAAEKGDWDLAVARYTRALDKDPKNIGYKIALENARIQASRFHYDEAKKHLAANDFEKAAEELRDREQLRPRQPLGLRRPRDRARAHPQAGGGAARAGRVRPDEGPGPGRGARAGARPLAAQPRADHHALRGRRACRRSSRASGASPASTCSSTRASATRRPR